MTELERVKNYLKVKAPELQVIEMDADTSTSALAAEALGTETGQIAKSILFRTKKDTYLMVVSAGDVKIDHKALKELTGSKVRMANAEEVKQVTGYTPGGVCPFAIEKQVDIFLDESLKRYDVVFAAAGTANTALPVSFTQLQEITGGIPCRVSGKQE